MAKFAAYDPDGRSPGVVETPARYEFPTYDPVGIAVLGFGVLLVVAMTIVF
jgi:hypothetical protein